MALHDRINTCVRYADGGRRATEAHTTSGMQKTSDNPGTTLKVKEGGIVLEIQQNENCSGGGIEGPVLNSW